MSFTLSTETLLFSVLRSLFTIVNNVINEGVRWPPMALINCIDDEGVAIAIQHDSP